MGENRQALAVGRGVDQDSAAGCGGALAGHRAGERDGLSAVVLAPEVHPQAAG
jgi:hypothetical protein